MDDPRPIPARTADVTIAWLARALAGAGVRVSPAASLAIERVDPGRGMTSDVARVSWPGGRAILKIAGPPDPATAPSSTFERCEREARFYRALAAHAGVRVPAAPWTGVDARAGRVALLLEFVAGADGDAAAGCTRAEAEAVVDAMAGMHARWWESRALADHPWLPAWGRGEAGAARPHARRAERFARRVEPFLARFGECAAPELHRVIRLLARDLEPHLVAASALPPTLIHGDLHLDNLRFAGEPVFLDWQSVSAGPAAYDLARFAGDLPRFPDLAARHHAALLEAGAPAGDLAAFLRAFRSMLLVCLAGLVSGYGGRAEHALTDRERAIVARAVSPEGLAGSVLTALSTGPSARAR